MTPEQKKIAATLAKRSLGMPFLFEPLDYRSGKTLAKPCDLVWACNGCIILFSLIDSARSREKMARHNFNHLKAWYRDWQSGRRLKGRNLCSSFDIPFDQYPYKVFLSVVKGPEATSELNPGAFGDLEVVEDPQQALCATVSQNVLEYIAENAGGPLDLLQFIEDLQDTEPLDAEASLRAIRRRHNRCFNLEALRQSPGDVAGDPRLYALDPIYKMLQAGQSQDSPGVSSEVALSERTWDSFIPSLLSDLSWPQIVTLICQARHLERKVGNAPPGVFGIRASSAVFDFSPYLFGLIVSKFSGAGGFDHVGEQVGILQQKMLNHENHRERFGIVLRCSIGDKGERFFSAFTVPIGDEATSPLKNQTLALLDRVNVRQRLRS
ncbi:MAG: hypothetical protein V4671_10210 [Armatimonadota bacterium]